MFYFFNNYLVDGQWSEWGSWESCSVTCGDGNQTRYRTCTNPDPDHGGAACDGLAEDSQMCSNSPCPGSYTLILCCSW